MTNTNSDPDYYLPSPFSFPKLHVHNQSTRKKRSKMVKLEPLMASSSSVITTTATTKNSGNACSITKKYYSKKPDPCAPKITRPCTECGKKFWSWKALFGHMRCHPERQWRGINPPPQYRKPFSPIQEFVSEEKESAMTEEDHEVASCLILLSSSDDHVGNVLENGFECSCCKKVFGSHQALGGHRASHKNVKGCFANTRSSDDVVVGEEFSNESVDVKRLMVLGHKCGICMRVFSSGQALGGHKRCHWEKGEEASSSALMNNQGFNVFPSCGGFDLNLPAPVEDDQSSSSYSSAFNSPSSLALDLRLGL